MKLCVRITNRYLFLCLFLFLCGIVKCFNVKLKSIRHQYFIILFNSTCNNNKDCCNLLHDFLLYTVLVTRQCSLEYLKSESTSCFLFYFFLIMSSIRICVVFQLSNLHILHWLCFHLVDNFVVPTLTMHIR